MASVLHDNPRSKRDDDKKADTKKSDEKDAAEKKAADKAKAAPAGDDEGEAKKPGYLGGDAYPGEGSNRREEEAGPGDAIMSPKDKFMDGMKAIQKRHESERRDHHGNHREALRQMAARHGKEISDHFDLAMPAQTDAPSGGNTEEA